MVEEADEEPLDEDAARVAAAAKAQHEKALQEQRAIAEETGGRLAINIKLQFCFAKSAAFVGTDGRVVL